MFYKRIIFHIDVNNAFLSWEAVYHLEHLGGTLDLREIPSAVGGDMTKRHGIILAKSPAAKSYGVKTGESIPEALKKCPHLKLVPPHYKLYDRASESFFKILREYSSKVEKYSVDEAFVDVTESPYLKGDPVALAHLIRERIFRELGFTVNVGISTVPLLAKMASDFEKPNKVHTLFPEEIPKKMWPLPAGELFFVGKATEQRLANIGIYTIGQIANAPLDILRAHLKKHGETIWNFANGRDANLVEATEAEQKGYGNSTTISFDVSDASTAKMVLLSLAETVCHRLRNHHAKAEVLTVGVRTSELDHYSHQKVLANATDITYEIHREACELFDHMWDGRPIRQLSLHTGRIHREEVARQLSLFDSTDYEKLAKVDRAIDEIRKKFGKDSIVRASFIEGKVDPMAGGVSREKRTVEYSKEKVQ